MGLCRYADANTLGPFARRWTVKTLMLTVVAAAFLTPPSQADDGVASNATTDKAKKATETVMRVAGHLKGRVLGSFVRKGMTSEQVARLLGGADCTVFVPSNAGLSVLHLYRTHGLSIDFASDKEGVLRVESVTFGALFD
jgi:hypothetical protein